MTKHYQLDAATAAKIAARNLERKIEGLIREENAKATKAEAEVFKPVVGQSARRTDDLEDELQEVWAKIADQYGRKLEPLLRQLEKLDPQSGVLKEHRDRFLHEKPGRAYRLAMSGSEVVDLRKAIRQALEKGYKAAKADGQDDEEAGYNAVLDAFSNGLRLSPAAQKEYPRGVPASLVYTAADRIASGGEFMRGVKDGASDADWIKMAERDAPAYHLTQTTTKIAAARERELADFTQGRELADVYDHKSGRRLGQVNDAVYKKYLAEADGSGAVDGRPYGFPGTIYMQD